MARLFALLAFAGLALQAENLPNTPAETVTGKKVDFPAILHGAISTVVFGFDKDSNDKITVWLESLTADGLNAWALANIENMTTLARPAIRMSLRKGTPAAIQSRSLVASKNIAAWKDALGVTRQDLPVVALFDADGQLVWHRQGTFSESISNELKAEIAKLMNR